MPVITVQLFGNACVSLAVPSIPTHARAPRRTIVQRSARTAQVAQVVHSFPVAVAVASRCRSIILTQLARINTL